MFSSVRSALVTALFLLSVQPIVMGVPLGDETKPPAINQPANQLAAADQLYRSGKFADAETSYRALLKTGAKLVPA